MIHDDMSALSDITSLRLAETNSGAPNEAYAVLDQDNHTVASVLDTWDEEEMEGRITEENVAFAHLLVHRFNKFSRILDALEWIVDDFMPDHPEAFDSITEALAAIEDAKEVE